MNKTFIYTLSDSEGNIRYVGKTNDPQHRLKKHLNEAKNKRTHKEKWIDSELNMGNLILLEIIDEVSSTEWSFWETYWISQFKTWGFNLVNGTSGGEGSDGFKGRTHSDETKEKLRNLILTSDREPTKLCGESNGRSKLKDYQVEEIKEKVSLGISRKEIAEEYNINVKYIYQLLTGVRRKQKTT